MVIGSEELKRSGLKYIGPASVDVTLSDLILLPKFAKTVVLGDRIDYHKIYYSAEKPFILQPRGFVLAATNEYFNFSKSTCGFVQGRSSIGRIGLTVQNAGFIDPGFYGTITLELVNESRNPIALIPDYRIAQVVFMDVRDNQLAYTGKYNGQIEPTESRMFLDAEAR